MTGINQILKRRQTLSVELWPPRSEEALVKLENSLQKLGALDIDFASITYGAGGTTRDRTHDLVVNIHKQQKMTPMAHLTCAYHSKQELIDILERYKAEGIENILALRGDPPVNKEADFVEGELKFAKDLAILAKEVGDFIVAVAAHPEGKDQAQEARYLFDKLQIADFAITQLFFDAKQYKDFMEKIDALGNTKPILPGIMPITSAKSLMTMARLTNQEVPAYLRDKVSLLQDNPEDVRMFGVEFATQMSAELLEFGVPGLHFYTMNETNATIEICKNLRYHIL